MLTDVHVEFDEDERWFAVHRGAFVIAANLADTARTVPVQGGGEIVLATGDADTPDAGLVLGAQSAVVLRRAG